MKWTLACIAVLACIGLASAFKCYDCNNAGNCADDMVKKATPSFLMPCDTGVTPAAGVTLAPFVACRKQVFDNGQVDRSCATLAQCPDSNKDSCSADGKVCCCSTSECNSATTRRVSYAVVASTLVVTLVAKLF